MVISTELADVLATIATRIRGLASGIPLVAAYDRLHERPAVPGYPGINSAPSRPFLDQIASQHDDHGAARTR